MCKLPKAAQVWIFWQILQISLFVKGAFLVKTAFKQMEHLGPKVPG
jgi:hypothetical protein